MSGEAGEAAGASGPADGDIDEQHDADVAETAKKLDAAARRMSKKQSMMHRRDSKPGPDERVEVDRTALEAILDVSQRLQDIQKKSKVSMSTLALAHESYKDKQVIKK